MKALLSNGKTKRILRLLLLLALCLIPVIIRDTFFLHMILLALIFVILLMGLNLVTGLTGQVSLCQAAFYGIGAYTSAILTLHYHFPFWVALPLAGLVAMVFGAAIGVPTVKMHSHYLALATIGFGEIMVNVFRSGGNLTGGANGLNSIPVPSFFSFTFSSPSSYYYLVLTCLIVVYVATHRLVSSQVGKAFISIGENEIAAECMGIDVVKYKILAFTLSAGYAGLAGSLYAHFDSFIGPESFGTHFSILYFCVIVIGGFGNLLGTVLGAFIITIGQEYLRSFAQYQMVFFGAAVILLMIVAPRGIAGILTQLKFRRIQWQKYTRFSSIAKQFGFNKKAVYTHHDDVEIEREYSKD